MYDFYLWEYDYGHNLDPKAIMNFKNPDGSRWDFSHHYLVPNIFSILLLIPILVSGAYMMFVGMIMTLSAFFVGKKEAKVRSYQTSISVRTQK